MSVYWFSWPVFADFFKKIVSSPSKRRSRNATCFENIITYVVEDHIQPFSKVKAEDKNFSVQHIVEYHDINFNIKKGLPTTRKNISFIFKFQYIVWVFALLIVIGTIFCYQDSVRKILLTLENRDPLETFVIFLVLYTIVSFPLAWGYIVLNLVCGYIYGFLCGTLITSLASNMGIFTSHIMMQKCMKNFITKHIMTKNLKVLPEILSKSEGFKIVMLARLSPVPLGLQNGIFAVYFTATFIGLLPTQLINSYVGSTVRSVDEVVVQTGKVKHHLIVLFIQVAFGAALLQLTLKKARVELNGIINAKRYCIPRSVLQI